MNPKNQLNKEDNLQDEINNIEDDDEIEVENNDINNNKTNNNFGFKPMDDEEEKKENEKKRKREEDQEEINKMKSKINRLLCRYPNLKPRTSHHFITQLESMDLEELNNIFENMLNDLSVIRGFPTSETAIMALTYSIDRKVPGYMNRCLKDEELKRDIDIEVMNLIGHGHNWVIIALRFVNHLIKTIYELPLTQHDQILYPQEMKERDVYVNVIPPVKTKNISLESLDGEPSIIQQKK